jgi:hypothetical protein
MRFAVTTPLVMGQPFRLLARVNQPAVEGDPFEITVGIRATDCSEKMLFGFAESGTTGASELNIPLSCAGHS